jgi:DNA-binding transcriptional MerR regulator
MLEAKNNDELPPIPGKRYFTIGEVSDLCGVKPHVLRYWEQEFPQLKPVKRRGNRRYYQRQDVLVIRQIRSLLYEEGFTIGGARNKLQGEEARTDVSQSQQIVKQLRIELEDVLRHPAPLIYRVRRPVQRVAFPQPTRSSKSFRSGRGAAW